LRIIERHDLTKGLRQKAGYLSCRQRVYSGKDKQTLGNSRRYMDFVVKVGLFSGLREGEARYIHKKEKYAQTTSATDATSSMSFTSQME
jgi:hypothetical protein